MPRIWGRRAPGGGVVIALVGVDGSGKSTATTNICRWLGPEIDVLKVYFGTGDGAPSLVLAPFKALAGLVARFIKTKPKGASHGQISDRPPGPVYSFLFAVWAIAVALDKRHKLIQIQRAARRGFIVVTDRYPQDEIERFNDGPLLHRLPWTPVWLRRFEASVYMRARRAPPDLVIKLHVGADAVARREPEMSRALIEDRLNCLQQLRFTGAKMVSIDAVAPLDVVTRMIKRAVWDIL
jgi:ABC-type dipeptide/oligopeptide/nickel transport system ATPase component